MIFLSHSAGKLIHNATVTAIKIIFRILANKRDIYHRHVEPKQVFQDHPRQHLQGGGRRQPGTIGDIPADGNIKAMLQLHTFLFKRPHDSLWVICPGSLLAGD